MNNHFLKYFKNPMLIVLVVILIFFTPSAIYSPGESRRRGVVTAVGIDKMEENYEVSLLTFIPNVNQSFKEVSSVISGKGKTMADAIYNAQTAMGRRVGLAHAKTTIVSMSLMQEDIASHIDYLSRVSSLPENTVIVCTDKTAKEVLEASFSLESNVGLQLEQVIGFNAENMFVNDTSLESFYKGYYSPVKSSIIDFLTVADKQSQSMADTQPAKQSGSDQVDTSGSKGTGETQDSGGKRIVNQGEAVIVKSGKFTKKLTLEELNGINLLNSKAVRQNYTVKDVTLGESVVDATYKVRNKNVNINTHFENGYPVFETHVVLGMELVEVGGQHEKLKISTESSHITPEISKKLDEVIKKQFAQSIKILRENSTDVIGVTEQFYRNNRKEYIKFRNSIASPEKFIQYVTFKVNLIIRAD